MPDGDDRDYVLEALVRPTKFPAFARKFIDLRRCGFEPLGYLAIFADWVSYRRLEHVFEWAIVVPQDAGEYFFDVDFQIARALHLMVVGRGDLQALCWRLVDERPASITTMINGAFIDFDTGAVIERGPTSR